jgi:hypothetical protein
MGNALDNIIKTLLALILVSIIVVIVMYAMGFKRPFLNTTNNSNSNKNGNTSNVVKKAVLSSEDKVALAQKLIDESDQHADQAVALMEKIQPEMLYEDHMKYTRDATESINLAMDKLAEASRLLEVSIDPLESLHLNVVERLSAAPNINTLIDSLKQKILILDEKVRKVKSMVYAEKNRIDLISSIKQSVEQDGLSQAKGVYEQMVILYDEISQLSRESNISTTSLRNAKNSGDLINLEDIGQKIQEQYQTALTKYNHLRELYTQILALMTNTDDPLRQKAEDLMQGTTQMLLNMGFHPEEFKLSNVTAVATFKGANLERAIGLYNEFESLSLNLEANSNTAWTTTNLAKMVVIHTDSTNLYNKMAMHVKDLKGLASSDSNIQQLYEKASAQLESDHILLYRIGEYLTDLEKAINAEQDLNLTVSINIVNSAIDKLRKIDGDLSQMQRDGDILLAQTTSYLKNSNATTKIDSVLIQAEALNTRASVAANLTQSILEETELSIKLNRDSLALKPALNNFNALTSSINKRIDSIMSILPSVKNFEQEALKNQKAQMILNIISASSMVSDIDLLIESNLTSAQEAYQAAQEAIFESNIDLIKAKRQVVINLIDSSQQMYERMLVSIGQLDEYKTIELDLSDSEEMKISNLLSEYPGVKSRAYTNLTSIINIKIGPNGLDDMIQNMALARFETLRNNATLKLRDVDQQIDLLSNILTKITQNRRNSNAMRNAMNTNSLRSLDQKVDDMLNSSIRSQQYIEVWVSEIADMLENETEPELVNLKNLSSVKLVDSALLLNNIRTLREEINGIYDQTQATKKAYVLNQAQLKLNEIQYTYQRLVSIKTKSDQARLDADLALSKLDLPKMRQLEIDQTQRHTDSLSEKTNLYGEYETLRLYTISHPYLELGEMLVSGQSMYDNVSPMVLDILRVKEYISTQMTEVKDAYVNQSITDVNQQINLIEFTFNKMISLHGQSELILSNVVAVIQSSDMESSLVYVDKQIGPSNLIVNESQKVLNDLSNMRTQLDGLKLYAESTTGGSIDEIDSLVRKQLLKIPAAESLNTTIYKNYLAILQYKDELTKKLQTMQYAISDAQNQHILLQNNNSEMLKTYADLQLLHDELLGVYNMPSANWEHIINTSPRADALNSKSSVYLENGEQIHTLIYHILDEYNNISVDAILAKSDAVINNIRITWYRIDQLMKDINRWREDALIVKNMQTILNSQLPKVSIVLQSAPMGEQIKMQAMSYYSTYEWDKIDDEINTLNNYIERNQVLIGDVNVIHATLLGMSNKSVPAESIIQKSTDNLSQMNMVQNNLDYDLREIMDRTVAAQKMANQEVNYAQVILDNSARVNTLMNSALNDVYSLNDVIQKATTAGRAKNQTAVSQYYNQSINLMNTMVQKKNDLGSVVEDSRTIMNQYIRDVPVNIQSAYDSLENDAQSMDSIIVSAQQMQTKWKQIYTSAGMTYPF